MFFFFLYFVLLIFGFFGVFFTLKPQTLTSGNIQLKPYEHIVSQNVTIHKYSLSHTLSPTIQ